MCGITALFEPSGPLWLGEVCRRMTNLVAHRGPDGTGLVLGLPAGAGMIEVVADESAPPVASATIALGHRRLAIIDLSAAGHQPMADKTGSVWITFNGEIYNYLELRHELSALGHRFVTETDTEVILAAWHEWGENCLSHLNGMFAFVLLDRRTQNVLIARDRFGEKPLYFWHSPTGGVAFVSEIKQLTAHPGWTARLNGQRTYDFLNWGISDHTNDTFFSGVQQVRGGEYILSSVSQLPNAAVKRWYQFTPAIFTGSFADASENFRQLLDDSVRLRLRADVPVGTCLSGGLDSSSIACTVRQQLTGDARHLQNTFSAYSEVARFDERGFINDVVTKIGSSSHHVIPTPEELLAESERLTWHQDEPFGSTSIWAQWCVFRLARQAGVKVMLDGQGADEALGGYQSYFGPHLAGLLRRGRLIRFAQESLSFRSIQNLALGLQLRWTASELVPIAIADRLRKVTRKTVRNPSFINLGRLGALPRSPHSGSRNLSDPIRSLSIAQLTSLNLPVLLHWADRDSMAHGVETRLPFLDHRLVEFCVGLPGEYKLRAGWTKRVLREGMRDRLPESIRLRRDKLGFATAEEVWMKGAFRQNFLKLLDQAVESSQGILNGDTVLKAQNILDGKEAFSFLIWRMINFGQWLRVFKVKP